MAKALYIENIEQFPAVLYSSTSPGVGYTDYTNNLIKWDEYGLKAVSDKGNKLQYKQFRDIIQPIVYSQIGASLENWGTVSSDVRRVAAKYIFVPYALRLSQHTEAQDVEYFTTLYDESAGFKVKEQSGRRRIVEEMKQYVALNYYRKELISISDAADFVTSTKDLIYAYLEFSSYEYLQWLTNAVGSPYEFNGFAQKSYYSETMKNELIDIYNGAY